MNNKLNFENNLLNWTPQFLFSTPIIYGFIWAIFKDDFLTFLYSLYIGFVLFSVSLILGIYINLSKGHYSALGYLYKWYDRTLKIMGVSWITDVWNSMCKLKLVDGNIVNFISPSGNKGAYEKMLFNKISTPESKINFIVSDKLNLKNHEESYRNYNNVFTYLPGKDALHIQETINECNIEDVNVIWDFKGMIWYSTHKCIGRYNKILQAFETYYTVLNDNGVIVIDNIYVNPILANINEFLNMFLKFRIGIGEISTVQKLDSILSNENAANIKSYLELNFEKHDIYYSDKTIVRVYKKIDPKKEI